MSEEVYDQVEYAIENKLHLGCYRRNDSMTWLYPESIQLGFIIMRWSDCGSVKPTKTFTVEDWIESYNSYGLYKRVGIIRY